MGSFSLVHWLIFGVIAILVLGGGRFSNMMGDVAKGIKQFKKGMAEDDDAAPTSRIEAKRQTDPTVEATAERVRDAER
ncbi:twin-arginine translocase TatA/TatE family subunit [Sphingomonas asaccharolytica]|jgi:sec-independent protein translocase protein TatA|uniref:twin-arginine translocase TatA/TatE family subunit n=1 Tax=Sphingomonas asaccharolytica TaxID=40681 RepID=UPI000832F595|nr:twin-arginine translocase TatA/TatE family subunit [Sphingomonas asaccharolytica]